MPSYTEVLGGLDRPSTPTYTVLSLCFPTSDPDSAVHCLKNGVQETAKQLPFLSGKIYTATPEGKSSKMISWSDENPLVRLEQITGLDLSTYAKLEERHMPMSVLSESLQPLEVREPHKFPRLSALALSYAKILGGLILTIAVHHQLMDRDEVEVLVDTLASNTRGEKILNGIHPKEPLRRKDDSEAVTTQIFTQCPDSAAIPNSTNPVSYSPPAQSPLETLLFRFSIQALTKLRDQLQCRTCENVSVTTAIIALIWQVVTQNQINRLKKAEKDLNASEIDTMLLLSDSLRPRVMGTGCHRNDHVWLGDSNMMRVPPAVIPSSWLDTPDDGHSGLPEVLPKMVDTISQSFATTSLNQIAGILNPIVKSSHEPGVDCPTQLEEMPLYRPKNSISTSVAALNLYKDFGPGLGRPQFVRYLSAHSDGVVNALVIPRKLENCRCEEDKDALEVLIGMPKSGLNEVVYNKWLRPLLLSDPE